MGDPGQARLRLTSALWLVVCMAAATAAQGSVSDDFADGEEATPAWLHYAPVPGTSFDASSTAYQLVVPATGNPLEPARAASLREEESFRDVAVAADLLAFDGLPGHAYGIVARGSAAAAPARDGYALLLRAAGELALVQIAGGVATPLASLPVALDTGGDYRLVLSVAGSAPARLTGELYALADLASPLATVRHADTLAPVLTTGFTGVAVEDASALQDQPLGASFDDFFAGAPTTDSDADGLHDAAELAIGTDPLDPDSDGDGLLDGVEIGTGSFGGQIPITTLSDGSRLIVAADVDGDGDTDILSASFDDDTLAWHENTGTPGVGPWPEHLITTIAENPTCIFPADIDGDGDLDVVGASRLDYTIAWYENDGTPGDGPWAEHPITPLAAGVVDFIEKVIAADLDKDGDMDVLAATSRPESFAWYENDGTPLDGPWTARQLAFASAAIITTDIDGDGDADPLSASFFNKLCYYDNDGTPAVGPFPEREFANNIGDPRRFVDAADFDGDGDMDVLSRSLTDYVAWYENDGTPAVGLWPGHGISSGPGSTIHASPADLDLDGDMDVLAVLNNDNLVVWYENDGTPAVGAWPRHTLSTQVAYPEWVIAADIDGDGDPDVISASFFDDKIAWYPQLNVADPLDADSDDDGLRDGFEVNASFTNPNAADSDGDGLLDGFEVAYGFNPLLDEGEGDLDPDLDGLTNLDEQGQGTHPFEPDTDGDGLEDGNEVLALGTSPLAADTDADGLLDGFEVTHGFDPLVSGDELADPDVDGLTNLAEQSAGTNPLAGDTDGDGLLDGFELTYGFDPLVAGEQDGDPDADGLTNLEEQTEGSNPNLTDTDGDGLGDGVEVQVHGTNPASADTDGDGLLDGFEVTFGFSPTTPGEQAEDPDADALTTLAEQALGTNPILADTDMDGLGDGAEANTHGTNPLAADTDVDGLADGFEVAYGFDPLIAGEGPLDPDADGLTNQQEHGIGTNPTLADTDGDGLRDGFEVDYGFDPLVAAEQDEDRDFDGLTNLEEQAANTNPNLTDTDGDGLHDGAEVTFYATNPNLADTDGDGLADGFEVNEHGTSPLLADTDDDAAEDGDDNCPVTPNPSQSDVGSVLDEPADGIGDACQCGDVDDSGVVDFADVTAYRDSLADPEGLPLTPAGFAKCSVIDGPGPCEILDVTVIQRELAPEPLEPGITQVCAAASGGP